MEILVKNMRVSGLIVVLGAILATAPPAAADAISFSFNLNGFYRCTPAECVAQPFSGTIGPFGQGQASWPFSSSSSDTITFTLANGMTFTASVSAAAPVGDSGSVTGTVTGGTGIFQGASGTFTGTITIGSGVAAGLPATFAGSGTITASAAPGGLDVLPSVLTFDIPQNSSSAAAQTLMLNNLGLSAQAFQVSASTTSGGNWLGVSPTSGTAAAAVATTVAVTANPAPGGAALAAGFYAGQVTVNYGTVSVSTDVQLVIGGLGGILALSESGLAFQGAAGGLASHAQTIRVANMGTGTLAGLTATTSVTGGVANWLNATVTLVAGNPNASIVTISVNPVPQVVGIYYGRVDLALPNTANSPQSVTVVLTASAGALPDITPTGVVLSSPPGGSSTIWAAPAAVTVANLGSNTVTYSAALAGVPGVPASQYYPANGASMDWLTVSPASGALSPGNSFQLTASVPAGCFVAADPCLLESADWREIALTFPQDNYTATIGVLLNIPNLWADLGVPEAGSAAVAGRTAKAAASCTPSGLNGVFTSLLAGFQGTVGLPESIEVEILDSCGLTMDSGVVVATFSSGDPPVTLTAIGGGQWAGTWTPRTAAAQTTVTVQAAESDAVAAMLQLSGSVSANTSTPIVNVGGIVNAASGAPTIAPGAFIEIYGLNLGGAVNVAPPTAYPTLLGGTQVLLGGQPMPLYFTSNQQTDAIVPYDIVPNSQQQVIVQTGTAYSQPEAVAVGVAEPGVFTQDQTGTGAGAIFGQKPGGIPTLNTAANPASAGDYLWIYCTGLGTVTPSVPAGAAAPTSTLSYTDNKVTVTVGGIDAQGLLAGLAPELVGLYQVNVIVPPGVAAGPSVPVVVSAAGAASAPVTVAIK